jgi:hypothetical protein
VPIDPTLDGEKIAELFREGWGGCRGTNGGRGVTITDRKFGTATFRAETITCLEPFVVFRLVPAETRITNRSREALTYSVRVARSEWSRPYRLAPRESHEFHTSTPLMFRSAAATDTTIKTLPMGADFVYGPTEQAPRPAEVASAVASPVSRN